MAGTFTGSRLWRVKLAAAVAKIFTAPALPERLGEIGVCNTDTVAHTVRLYVVPTGIGAVAVEYAEFYDLVVPPKTTLVFLRNGWLEGLDEVWAGADAANVVACWGCGTKES